MDIAGVEDLGTTNRGRDTEIGTYVGKIFQSELSGNVVDLCPVGALTSKPYTFIARPWELRSTETIDISDAVGSNIRVDFKETEVVRVLPRLNEKLNEEWISDKSRFSFDSLKIQRLDSPYIKGDDRLQQCSWQTAVEKLKTLCEKILQQVRDHFGRVKVTSGFRSPQLCQAIGSSINSQHSRAEAADFECVGVDNAELFDWIKNNLEPDQLILEYYTPGEPNSGWIHASYVPFNPRHQYMRAYREEKKTKYKPIIGKAVDLV